MEFDADSTCFWLATDKGLIVCMSVETGKEIGKPFKVSGESEKPISRMRRFSGIND